MACPAGFSSNPEALGSIAPQPKAETEAAEQSLSFLEEYGDREISFGDRKGTVAEALERCPHLKQLGETAMKGVIVAMVAAERDKEDSKPEPTEPAPKVTLAPKTTVKAKSKPQTPQAPIKSTSTPSSSLSKEQPLSEVSAQTSEATKETASTETSESVEESGHIEFKAPEQQNPSQQKNVATELPTGTLSEQLESTRPTLSYTQEVRSNPDELREEVLSGDLRTQKSEDPEVFTAPSAPEIPPVINMQTEASTPQNDLPSAKQIAVDAAPPPLHSEGSSIQTATSFSLETPRATSPNSYDLELPTDYAQLAKASVIFEQHHNGQSESNIHTIEALKDGNFELEFIETGTRTDRFEPEVTELYEWLYEAFNEPDSQTIIATEVLEHESEHYAANPPKGEVTFKEFIKSVLEPQDNLQIEVRTDTEEDTSGPIEDTLKQVVERLMNDPSAFDIEHLQKSLRAISEELSILPSREIPEKIKVQITEETLDKLLSVLRELGYKNPEGAVREIVSRYGIHFLLQFIYHMNQLTKNENRQEYSRPLLLSPLCADWSKAAIAGKMVINIIMRQLKEARNTPSYS